MLNTNQEAFVYCWTDHLNEMYYIGSHKGTEDDGYVCGQPWMEGEYNKRPGDFTRQIIAKGSYDDMYEFETTIIKKGDLPKDPKSYNMSYNNGKFYYTKGFPGEKNPMYGKPHPNKGKKINSAPKHHPFWGLKGKDHPLYGVKKPEGHGQNVSKALTGKKKSDSHRQSLKEAHRTDEYLEKTCKPVIIHDKYYSSIKQAKIESGVSHNKIWKGLKDEDNKDIRYA